MIGFRTRLASLLFMVFALATTGAAATNLARLGTASASSIWQDRPEMAPAMAIDGDLTTRWGGAARGEWFQIEWQVPQTFCGVVLHNYNEAWNKHIPFTLEVWDPMAAGGSGAFKDMETITPATSTAVFSFTPVTTRKLRVKNVITFWELEIYNDQEVMRALVESSECIEIAVAGDLLGHLIGTVSTDEGSTAVAGAGVVVSGTSPQGTWSRDASSADNGLFQVDLPLNCTGRIDISAQSNALTGKLSVESEDISQRLTPRPPGKDASRLSLTGEWDIAADPLEGFISQQDVLNWEPISVPSHWRMEGITAETGRVAYRRTFDIPSDWTGKRIKFRSEGIYSAAEVWVNGQRAGRHVGGATPFELDITGAAMAGAGNEILILVEDRSDASTLDAMSYYAHLNLGGIWRPLEVFCVEPAHISRLAVVTDFDENHEQARLKLDVRIDNEQAADVKDMDLRVSITDPQGNDLKLEGLSKGFNLRAWESKDLKLEAVVRNPEPWNAEKPRLYGLRAQLVDKGQEVGEVDERFGFKEVEVDGRTFKVNGRPVKLWGACRHDADPLRGRAITSEIARQDAELMKGANLNSFRNSHYPPHPAVMEYADEYGLYVEDEGPFCFVGAPYGPLAGRQHSPAEDLRLAPLALSLTSALLERDRNHPSVVIWSICNESHWGPVLSMTHDFVWKSDPTRPTSAGQSANLEIATYHNPTSMTRMRDTAELTMPVLFDEGLAIFQGFGAQAQGLELDPGLRDFWVSAHFEPIQALRDSEHQFGTQIWAWVDDAFLVPGEGINYGRLNGTKCHFVDEIYKLPGRGIVGDPIWGMIDGWRRPRPEWWLCKKLFSPIEIDESPLDPDGPIRVRVRNRNTFINLNEYLCRWTLAGQTGQVRVEAGPAASGVLAIVPGEKPESDDTLTLEFFDERGRLIDGYRLPFRAHEVPVLPGSGHPARICEEAGTLDFGSFVRLIGQDTELAFDRTSGGLVRGLAGGEPVILAGPKLHIMKADSPLDDFPFGWQFGGAQYRSEGSQAVLNWNGRFGEITGGYEIRMDDAGDAEIHYRYINNGPETVAREVGVTLELPLACDRLQWDRDAEWSYYPDDHIGRPQGVAHARSGAVQSVPPGDRPFGLDDHPWGCNDFRSCKRNIYSASLTSPAGYGVYVVSNGRQHVRASVSLHSIRLHVLDYYGGSATGMNEWDGAYGAGIAIKPGDVIEGAVKLRLLRGQPVASEANGSD